MEAKQRTVWCVLYSFVTMTIKRESSTPFGSSSDEELQDYDSHTPSEGEVQEVQEPRSRVPRRMDESRRAPNPIPERGAADVLARYTERRTASPIASQITSMRTKASNPHGNPA